MADSKIPADIRKLSFEDALQEMEAIVKRLEKGDVKLDQAIESYARGALLKAHCQAKLKEAQARIEKIVLGSGGEVGVEPADMD
jgi:exodeoxyribonuclease VII small subunit